MISNHHNSFMGNEVKEKRSELEIFINVIQGKLGEIDVKKYITSKYKDKIKIIKDIDWEVYPIGEWDDGDMVVNKSRLSIKSIKEQSVVLMIEKARFDENGNYVYKNKNNTESKVDYYILVGITNINIKDISDNFYTFYKNNFNLNNRHSSP